MSDDADENKSQEIVYFFESLGVKNYFSTPNEQWQNGLPEAVINSIMMVALARAVMVESKLGVQFSGWFKSSVAGLQALHQHCPSRLMHVEKRDVFWFCAF
jgi:hypothetical protein